MDITSLMTESFTPKYRGNDKLEKDERIVAQLEYLSVEEYDPISEQSNEIIKRCVKKLSNLKVNGQAVEDGPALLAQKKRDVGDLVAELYRHIVFGSILDTAEEKNSVPRSS